MFHGTVYRIQEYLDILFAPLVLLYRWLILSVGEEKGYTNHPAWELGVDLLGDGRWFT